MKLSKKQCVALLILLFSVNVCASNWSTFRHDYARTGYTDADSNYSLGDLELLWYFPTGEPVRSSPIMADINGDGILEVIFGSDSGYLYVLDYKGNMLWNYSTGARVKSVPSVADINNDSLVEVVFGSDDGNLYVLNSSGQLLWNFHSEGPIVSSAALINMDDTPELEIIFGSMDGKIYLLNHEGELKWSHQTADSIESTPAVADVNNDGDYEIVIGSNDKVVYIVRYRSFKMWQYTMNGNVVATPVISDYDADGSNEIIVSSTEGRAYPIHQESYDGWGGSLKTCRIVQNGTEMCTRNNIAYTRYAYEWDGELNFSSDGEILSSPVVADLDGDGNMEIAFGSTDRSFYVLNSTGKRTMRYTVNGQILSSPSAADLDGDGILEIIFGSNDKSIYIINYPGGGKWVYKTNGSVRSSAAIGDLAANGALEIAIGSDDGNLYLFGSKTTMVLGEASAFYLAAEAAYDAGNITRVRELINKSSAIYQEVDDITGIRKCNALLKRVEADEYYSQGKDLYNDSQYRNASVYIEKASLLYAAINYAQGRTKVHNLLSRMDADTYLLEAQYFYEVDDFDNATIYANKSRHLGLSINYTMGVKEAEDMMNKTTKRQAADRVYLAAVERYYNFSDSENATRLLNNARTIYVNIEYANGIKIVDRLLNRIDGEKDYDIAEQYYNKTDYVLAEAYAKNATARFEEINYTTGIAIAGLLLNKSTSQLQAEDTYSDAEDYYTATDFLSASVHAQRAKEIYQYLEDADGVRRADIILTRSNEMQERRGGKKIPYEYLAILVPVLLLVLLRIRKVRAVKKKEKDGEAPAEEKPPEIKDQVAPVEEGAPPGYQPSKLKTLLNKLTKKKTTLEGVGKPERGEFATAEEKPPEEEEKGSATSEVATSEKSKLSTKIKFLLKKLRKKPTKLEAVRKPAEEKATMLPMERPESALVEKEDKISLPMEIHPVSKPVEEVTPHEEKPTLSTKIKNWVKKLRKKQTKLEGVRKQTAKEEFGVVEEKPPEVKQEIAAVEEAVAGKVALPEKKLTLGAKIKSLIKKLRKKPTKLEKE